MATCTRCVNPLFKKPDGYYCRKHGWLKPIGKPTYGGGKK